MSKSQPPTSAQPPRKKPAGDNTPRIQHRRAYYDFHILDKIECGIELVGSEVKSVRQGKVQLAQSFAQIRNAQITLLNCHIDEYTEANKMNHDPKRDRRLLLHRREIRRLEHRLAKEGGGSGTTLIPLEIYFKRGFAKVLLGLAKGKRQFDKRAAIKERDDKRAIQKALRHRP